MLLKCLVPNKFIGRYPLRTGTILYAIIFACVTIVCIVMVALQMIAFSKCDNCTRHVRRIQFLQALNATEKSAYGFSGAFIIICIIMLFVHVLYLWYEYTRKMRSSVVLMWVVTTAIWLGQTFCLSLVLLCLYEDDVSLITWSLCFIFGLLAYAIAAYGVLVGYGYYREMKRSIFQQ